ncbi:BapA/Bap/LapF family large adhesin [Isoalcanivorax beigongshangi]|uniref:BapA/Bap/LapF family large adhesin n=1 Tax=Isoalcanivorax beigongshangi TaxID=3238810 RepID=A0ABV4AJY3_9GAMM
MSNPVQVLIQTSNGAQSGHVARPGSGQTVTVPARSGMTVELRDATTQVAPDQVVIRRSGDDLQVFFDETAAQHKQGVPDVVLTDYYALENPPELTGVSEDGKAYAYVPQDGQTESLAAELVDGATSHQSLGYDAAAAGAIIWWPWLLAGLLIAGGVAAGSSSSSSSSKGKPVDTTPPKPAEDVTFSDDGDAITGKGEPGATVDVYDSNGDVIATGTVDADGTFTVPVNPPLTNGETVDVVLTDDAGNSSLPVTAVAPDTTAPDQPTDVTITSTDAESQISGKGEPGAGVTIYGPDGNVLAVGQVNANGTFTIVVQPPLTKGEVIEVVQTDAAGNTSDPRVEVTAPIMATNVKTKAVEQADGSHESVVSGNGKPGADVVVRGADGTELGRGTVGQDGKFEITLSPAQLNGEPLTVQVAPTAPTSVPTDTRAPDITPPAKPDNVDISDDGSSVTGDGEPGTTVVITDGDGNVVGEGTVDDDGHFDVTLDPPLTDGETVDVVLKDDAGNSSDSVQVTAPDTTAPDAPTDVTFSPGGDAVSGKGEPGADVTITDGDGNLLGSGTVDNNGNFTVGINPPLVDGETVDVVLTDDAGNDSDPTTATAPDLTPPDAPTDVLLSDDGDVITGKGEPNTQVSIKDSTGKQIATGTVDADGTFTVPVNPPLTNGETVDVSLVDAADNESPAVPVSANDTTPPAKPTDLKVNDDGTELTGKGEPGASVTVTNAAGDVIGTGNVGTDGKFSVTLAPAQILGQTLDVTLTDAAGNVSEPGQALAPTDGAPPRPTDLDVSADGAELTGKGRPNSDVTVTDADGNVLGTGTVDNNGDFTVTLSPPQTNGETLDVVLSDATGESLPAQVDAPDTTPPEAAEDVEVNADGTRITGTGEPGTTVTVRDQDGTIVATGPVDPNGNFDLELTPPQTNGEQLDVVLTDDAGNDSPDASTVAPDLTPPDPATDLKVSVDGEQLTGKGEPGAAVTVKDADGNEIATGVVDANGDFSIPLDPPQTGGEQLSVELTDDAGNVSDPALVLAHYEISAANNAVTLPVDVVPSSYDGGLSSKTSFVVANLGLGILDLAAVDLGNTLQLEVAEDTVRQITLKAGGGGVSILSFFDLFTYKFNESDGQWHQVRVDSNFLKVYLLGGASNELSMTLEPGKYMFLVGAKAGISVLTGYTLRTVSDVVFDYSKPLEASGQALGNVITDADPNHGMDDVPDGSVVTAVDGQPVTDTTPAVIEGQYGTLTLHADGSYEYVLKPEFKDNPQYGVKDVFTYTVTAPNGSDQATAELEITLGRGDQSDAIEADAVVVVDVVPSAGAPANAIGSKTDFGVLKAGLGPILGADALTLKNSLKFDVGENTFHELTLFANGGGVAVASLYDLVIYRYDEKLGKYVEYHVQNGWLDIPLLGGVSSELSLGFTEGSYAVALRHVRGLSLLTGTTVGVKAGSEKVYDYNNPSTLEGEVSGDVNDNDDSQVIRVDGTKMGANGTLTVDGEYGTLEINADGSYTYTIKPVTAGEPLPYGKVDSFSYTLRHADGSTSVGALKVKVDVLHATDDVRGIEVPMEKLVVEQNSGDESWGSGIGKGQTKTAGTFEIHEGDQTTHINMHVSARVQGLGETTLTYKLIHIDENGVETVVYTDQAKGKGENAKLTLDITTDGLAAGSYRLDLSTSGVSATIVRLRFQGMKVTTTYHDEYVEKTLPDVSGNLYGNDLGIEELGSVTIEGKTMVVAGGIGGSGESLTLEGQYGTLTVYENGTYRYKPNGTGYGEDSFDYTLTSKIGTTSSATLTVTVSHDAPNGKILPNVTTDDGSPAISDDHGVQQSQASADDNSSTTAADALPDLSDLVSLPQEESLSWNGDVLADAAGSSAAVLPEPDTALYLADRLEDNDQDLGVLV